MDETNNDLTQVDAVEVDRLIRNFKGSRADELFVTSSDDVADRINARGGNDVIELSARAEGAAQTSVINTGRGSDTVILNENVRATVERGFSTKNDVFDVSNLEGVNSFEDISFDVVTNEESRGNGEFFFFEAGGATVSVDENTFNNLSADNFIFADDAAVAAAEEQAPAQEEAAEEEDGEIVEAVAEEQEEIVEEEDEDVVEVAAEEQEEIVEEEDEEIVEAAAEEQAPGNLNTDVRVFDNGNQFALTGTDDDDLLDATAFDTDAGQQSLSGGKGADTIVVSTDPGVFTQVNLGNISPDDPINDPSNDDGAGFPDDEAADTVVVNSTGGEVQIFDFNAGDNGQDRIDLSNTGITSFNELTITNNQALGGSTVIEADNLQAITVRGDADGVNISNQFDDFNEDDFIFADDDVAVG